jgi:hypothetical protein
VQDQRHAGEGARIDAWIDDVAVVIGEQQLADEPARQAPDHHSLGEPRQEAFSCAFQSRRVIIRRHVILFEEGVL